MKINNDYIKDFIKSYMSLSENNNMKELPGFAFDEPIVGFSRGGDELYDFYKEHIDRDFYRTPAEWLESAFGRAFNKENISVISWFLPQTEDTKEKCRELDDCPAFEWTMVRVHGEECNRRLAKALEEHLCSMGYPAIAPMSSDDFSWGDSEKFVRISNWSERHTAYISGLGTFGLCDGLITEKGKAGRFGSVIVELPLEPTERRYSVYNEYCLANDGCQACIKRCPAGAITERGHDKVLCMKYHAEVIKKIDHERYGYDGYSVCGLCQTGVPCESCNPRKGRK
jgi:epoxyqueuosine reductase QueG